MSSTSPSTPAADTQSSQASSVASNVQLMPAAFAAHVLAAFAIPVVDNQVVVGKSKGKSKGPSKTRPSETLPVGEQPWDPSTLPDFGTFWKYLQWMMAYPAGVRRGRKQIVSGDTVGTWSYCSTVIEVFVVHDGWAGWCQCVVMLPMARRAGVWELARGPLLAKSPGVLYFFPQGDKYDRLWSPGGLHINRTLVSTREANDLFQESFSRVKIGAGVAEAKLRFAGQSSSKPKGKPFMGKPPAKA